MRKTLVVVLAVLMLCTCVLFAGCQNSKFKALKDSIIENGREVSEYNFYTVTLSEEGVTEGTDLNYFIDHNQVELSYRDYYDGASASMSIYIDSKLSGKYHWIFDYYRNGTIYILGGTFYAARVTSTNVKGAFVENISERHGDMTTEIASIALNLAKSLGERALKDFELYIVYQTDLSMADFGFKYII